MKFLVAFIAAIFVSQVASQYQPAPAPVPPPAPAPVPPPVLPPPVLPGLGLGLGLGLPLGLGLGFPLFPRFLFGRRFLIGKRSAEERGVEDVKFNKTICSWTTNSTMIKCTGDFETIECPVEPRLDVIKDLTVRLPNLGMVMDVAVSPVDAKKKIPVIELISRVIESKWTFVHPKTMSEVVLSIYSDPMITIPGFFIKDIKCYSRIESLVTKMSVNNLGFSIVYRV